MSTVFVQRSSRLRTIATLGALGAIAVAVVLLANAIGGLHLSLFGTNRIDRSAPVVLKELRDVSKYTAATGEFQATVDVEDDVRFVPAFLAGERTIFFGIGTVDATVDFRGLTADAVVIRGGTVTVTLPEPELAKPVIDPARSYVADRDRGLIDRIEGVFTDSPTSERGLYLKAQRRVAIAARNSALARRAEENTAAMLRGMLGKLGFERVDVVFTGPTDTTADPRRL
jgi:hypothetical protein